MPVRHQLVMTTPDDPAYENQPQHWNQDHALTIVGGEIFGAFDNSGNVKFGLGGGGSVSASAGINVSAGTLSQNRSDFTFANSPTVTFGLETNGVITAIAAGGAADGGNIIAAGTRTATTVGSVLFDNANGITFGLNAVNGSVITASHNGLTSQSNQAFSAVGGSSAFQTLSFNNANGVSFSNVGGALEASYSQSTHTHRTDFRAITLGGNTAGTSTFNASNNDTIFLHGGANITLSGNGSSITIVGAAGGGGNFSAGVSDLGNTVGDTGITGTRLVFAGGNNVTLSQVTDANGATITISGANAGGAQTGISGIQVSDTTYTSGTVTFRNANGISFGSSGANGISASYTVPVQTNQTAGIYAVGNTTGQSSSSTYDARTLSIDFAGIVSGGWSNGSVRISATQSGQAVSGSNGSFAFQTVTFGSSNGMHFYTTNGSLVGSYTVPAVTNSSWTVSDNGTSGTVARLAFTNLNGVTLSLSTGAGGSHTIVGSHNALTSQSTQFMALTLGGNTAGTTTFHATNNASLFFHGGNNITLSGNGSSVTISGANQSVQTQPISVFMTSNTTQSSSGTFAANSLLFNGAGIASVGYSNGSIIISVPAGGGGGDGVVSLGMSTEGNTAGTTGTVSSGRYIFVGSGAVSLSQSLNGQSGTLSIIGPATSSLVGASGITVSTAGSTISVGLIPISRWAPDVAITAAGSSVANSSVSLVPFRLEAAVNLSQVQFAMSVSGVTTTNNSQAGMQMSASVVLYTRNASTLSSILSGSVSFSNSYSSNATASFNGPRQLTVSFGSSTMLTPGEYWMAVHISTVTTGNTNLAKSISMGVIPTWQSGFGVLNYIGSGQTNTRGPRPGLAIHSTGATRATIAFSDITGHSGNSASLANLWFALRNYSIW